MTDISQVPANAKVSSQQFALNWQDALRGLIMSVLGAGLGLIEASIEAGNLNFNWKQIGITAGAAGIGYLMKNFLQKPVIQIPVTPAQVDNSTLDKTAK